MYTVAKFALVITLGLLASCSSMFGLDSPFRDRSNDYLKASEVPAISVPEGLDSDSLNEIYPVPPANTDIVVYESDNSFEIPRPKAAATNLSADDVKIQSLDGVSWILISVPPSEAWPRVRSFMSRNAVPTLDADAQKGIIESGWFSFTDSEDVLHQFRFILEQGVRLSTTEIVVQQRSYGVASAPAISPSWDDFAGATNPDREQWMRTQLAQTLATEELSASTSLLGLDIGAAPKVSIVTPRW